MNTLATLTAENKTFYDKTLLKRLLPELVFAKYGQTRNLPKNNGDKINFRKFGSLEPATTPLTEGVTPEGSELSVTAIEAQVKQYGDYTAVSDKLDLLGIDPVLVEAAEILGEQAGLTIDTIVRDEICSGTNVQIAGGKTRATITADDKLTVTEVQKAVRTLRKANVKPFDGGCYIFLIDPECAFDIMNDSKWEETNKYSGNTRLEKGEIGRIAGARFVTTSNLKVVKGGAESKIDVHQCMVIGKDAYGVVDVDGTVKPEMIVIPPEVAGGPLKQKSTAGWKALFTAKRLNELAMVRIECAASV